MSSKEQDITADNSTKIRRNSDINKRILSDPAHPVDVHFRCPANSDKKKLFDPNVDLKSEIIYQNEIKSSKSFPQSSLDDNHEESKYSKDSLSNVKRTHEKCDFRRLAEFPRLSTSTDKNRNLNVEDVMLVVDDPAVPEQCPTDLIQLKSPITTEFPARSSFYNKLEDIRNPSNPTNSMEVPYTIRNKKKIQEKNCTTAKPFESVHTHKELSKNFTDNKQKMDTRNKGSTGKASDLQSKCKQTNKAEFKNSPSSDEQKKLKNKTKQQTQPFQKDILLTKDTLQTKFNQSRGCNFYNCWSKMSLSEPILFNSKDMQNNPTNKTQDKDISENHQAYLPHYSAYLGNVNNHRVDKGKSENVGFDKSKSSKNSENSKRRNSGDIVLNKDDTFGENIKTRNVDCATNFAQESDSSAIFRKVFTVDGVGVECCCSISGYKTNAKI